MNIRKYIKHPYCYTSKIKEYGYAFVPGNKAGIVILDMRTKELLENLATFQSGIDEPRVELLQKKGL